MAMKKRSERYATFFVRIGDSYLLTASRNTEPINIKMFTCKRRHELG